MALSPYTSNADVRAVLGITDVELPDTVIDLPIYSIGLAEEINRVSPALPAAFSAAQNAQPAADSDTRLVSAVWLFATYAAARQVAAALPLLATRSMSDEKAKYERFSGDPYKAVMAAIESGYASTRAGLEGLWASIEGATPAVAATPRFFFAVKRTYDPVVGS